ncbi:MAG: hypothetical protein AB7P21_03135 [Lautropia sp.]
MNPRIPSRAARGQAMVEYLLLTALIGLVLVIGQDSPLEMLFRAFQDAWGRFTYAMSMP